MEALPFGSWKPDQRWLLAGLLGLGAAVEGVAAEYEVEGLAEQSHYKRDGQRIMTNAVARTAPLVDPWKFTEADFPLPTELARDLVHAKVLVPGFLWSRFEPDTKALLERYDNARNAERDSLEKPVLAALSAELNKIIEGELLYSEERFQGVILAADSKALLLQKPTGEALRHLNRMLLEDAFPQSSILRSVRSVSDPRTGTRALVDHKNRLITFHDAQGKQLSQADFGGYVQQSNPMSSGDHAHPSLGRW